MLEPVSVSETNRCPFREVHEPHDETVKRLQIGYPGIVDGAISDEPELPKDTGVQFQGRQRYPALSIQLD